MATISVFTVESLYYSAELRELLANRQAETLGQNAAVLLAEASNAAISELRKPETVTHLAARISERSLREKMLSAIPDRNGLIANTMSSISVSIPSPYPDEHARLVALLNASELDLIIDRYPVRESGALTAIAKALRFSSRADYERAALARVAVDTQLATALKAKLGGLPIALAE